jgi:hypothetical protein
MDGMDGMDDTSTSSEAGLSPPDGRAGVFIYLNTGYFIH